MQKFIFCSLLTVACLNVTAQLTIERGSVFFLQSNASVYVQGDLSSKSDILGPGYIELGGEQTPRIDMNGFQVSNLLINAAGPIVLESDISILSNLMLRSGHLQLNDHHILLQKDAVISGSEKSYVQTTGTGTIIKNIPGEIHKYIIPLGTAQSYLPLEISTNGKNQYGQFEVAASNKASSYKPANATDFLNYHWKIRLNGNMQRLAATGHYSAKDIQGDGKRLSSYYWNGMSWTPQASLRKQNAKVTANITPGWGELYAMNNIIGPASHTIRILKNPARSFTVIEINGIDDKVYHTVLRDVTGRQLQVKNLRAMRGISHHSIFLEGLSNGIYFLDIVSDDERQSFRILKNE